MLIRLNTSLFLTVEMMKVLLERRNFTAGYCHKKKIKTGSTRANTTLLTKQFNHIYKTRYEI